MPKRTTEFQTIVRFVRQHTAAEGVTVTESKLLRDSRLEVDREVDVVVEGHFDGEPIVTSIEVREHGRRADLPWVEQQVAKHRHLPTNRLISQSGFTGPALGAVAAEGGWVEALQPEIVERDGNPVVERLYLDEFSLKPTACRLTVLRPDITSVVVNVTETPDVNVYNADGEFLGQVLHLAQELLNLPWLVRRFGEAARNPPDRESLKSFTVQTPIAECQYFLHSDDTQEDHLIIQIHVTGEFAFVQTEMQFQASRIGDRAFGSGRGQNFGRESVWVGTTDEQKGQTRISWKPLNGRDGGAPTRPAGNANQFPALLDIPAPADWTEDEEITEGVGFIAVRPRADGLPAQEPQTDT